jgi:enamine deaminase RidA (YjgF/YER057c/UK114 family)
MTVDIEAKLSELGLSLPASCTPRGNFLPYNREGNLLFLAGQICEWNADVPYRGTVLAPGQEAPAGMPTQDLAAGRKAAEICGLNLLFHLRDACDGDLGRVRAFVRVGGFVNCLAGFDQSPAVINGASDLFISLFGEGGRHARTAVGVSGLPANASVEVDAVVALKP